MAKTTKSTENSATKKATTKKATSRKTTKKETSAPAPVTRSTARPAVIYAEAPHRTAPIPVFEYDEWGGDEGDRAQYATALAEHVRQVEAARNVETVRDYNPMPFVELMYPMDDGDDEPEIVRCYVSEKKSFMHLEDNAMQLSIQSPVGKYIWNNRNTIKEGGILPMNGAKILRVGFACMRNAHLAAANV